MRSCFSLVAACLISLAAFSSVSHARPADVQTVLDIGNAQGETVQYGPFDTEDQADRFAALYGSQFSCKVTHWFGYGWYVDVTF